MRNITNFNPVVTMSSREIAELVQSKHGDVKRSADRLAAAGILTAPLAQFEFEHNGNTYIEYRFNKRDSLVLVARLSPEFTAAVVDRWQELESGQQLPLSELDMIARIATAAANQERRLHLIEDKQQQSEQRIDQIATGAIPPGWQTIRNLSASSGITDAKTRAVVAAYGVQSKKVPFMTPTGVLSTVTIVSEQQFELAFDSIRREAVRGLRSKFWSHPKLGRFEIKEMH